MIGSHLSELPTPCFVIDITVVRSNCSRMLNLADKHGIKLRGQTKTHKTIEGALLQTGGTKRCLVTSTLREAEMYANAGFDDILYGYPMIEHHMKRNYDLANKLEFYHLMVTNDHSVDVLTNHRPPEGKRWSVFLGIDCGNGREGVWWKDNESYLAIAKRLEAMKEFVELKGLYVHCGNSYSGENIEAVKKVRDESSARLLEVKRNLENAGILIHDVGIGSTPSCSHNGTAMGALTEIHPGNYVFYDVQQMKLGSCEEKDIAGRVMTRIIGHYPRRNQMLIDCGFLGITKQGFQELGGSFGLVQGHPDLKVVAMTQEIGFIGSADVQEKIDFQKYPIGSTLFLLPYHSCATSSCYQSYIIHERDIVKEIWNPCKHW